MKDQHVSQCKDGSWKVQGAGDIKAASVHNTQKQAIEAAKKMAKKEKSEVVIHGRDGKIRAKDSYGNDPYPPKG